MQKMCLCMPKTVWNFFLSLPELVQYNNSKRLYNKYVFTRATKPSYCTALYSAFFHLSAITRAYNISCPLIPLAKILYATLQHYVSCNSSRATQNTIFLPKHIVFFSSKFYLFSPVFSCDFHKYWYHADLIFQIKLTFT